MDSNELIEEAAKLAEQLSKKHNLGEAKIILYMSLNCVEELSCVKQVFTTIEEINKTST